LVWGGEREIGHPKGKEKGIEGGAEKRRTAVWDEKDVHASRKRHLAKKVEGEEKLMGRGKGRDKREEDVGKEATLN